MGSLTGSPCRLAMPGEGGLLKGLSEGAFNAFLEPEESKEDKGEGGEEEGDGDDL
jgi:hypothetical protein